MRDRVAAEHIAVEELAQHVEGTLAPLRAAEVRGHLAGCRHCLAAYEEAVRDRAALMGTSEPFAAPAGWEKAHLEVLPMRDVRSVPALRRRSRTAWKWAAAAAAIIAVSWVALAPRNPVFGSLPPAIRTEAERASSAGLVLPGGEAGAATAGPAYRGGGDDLSSEISSALATYERDRDPAALRAACTGLVVSGQLATANGYIREGLQRNPRDLGLLLLAADAAYRQSRLGDAEQHLRSALRLHPRNPIANLDLAIVLSETGREAEANRSLQRIAEHEKNSPLGVRARRELLR